MLVYFDHDRSYCIEAIGVKEFADTYHFRQNSIYIQNEQKKADDALTLQIRKIIKEYDAGREEHIETYKLNNLKAKNELYATYNEAYLQGPNSNKTFIVKTMKDDPFRIIHFRLFLKMI